MDSKQAWQVYERSSCLVDEAQLSDAMDAMAQKITSELADKNPLVLCVMRGGLIFSAQMALRLQFPLDIDYIHVSRYHGQTSGGEHLHWYHAPKLDDLKDRTVLLLDDILDKGITLQEVSYYCQEHGAAQVYSGVMLDKKVTRAEGGMAKANFSALEIEDHFVFGYGLDYHHYLRNVPGIYVVAPEDM